MNSHHQSERGFSLIELLIVVVILGIIAAIAIPYFERAKQPANAASAVNSLRLINSGEVSYRTLHGRYGDLPALVAAGNVDDGRLRTGQKSNYNFNITLDADPAANYEATATPLYEPAASNHYFVNATGVIRTQAGAAATAASPPLN
jgi:prepilin-type N-terminal cleavage/methylation domain-containing protein